jgi:SAM-dependent methyltransferase
MPADPLAGARERALALVGDVLGEHLDAAQSERILSELRERADALGEGLVLGVNPPRTDYGHAWEDARAAAYAPTERAGAVHLELGTWTAFPDDHTRKLIETDGLAELIRLDAFPGYPCDVIADATALPFRSGSIDRVGSNSTVEHISDPHAVFEEAHRVLRPGGVLTTAMPFVWHEHGYPHDFVRLTRGFFEKVLNRIGFVDIEVDQDGSSGLYYTLHNAAKMAEVDEAHPEHAAMKALQDQLVTLLGTMVPLDRHFTQGARYWYHSVRVLARKPGTYEPSRRVPRFDLPFAERAIDLLADPVTKAPVIYKKGRVLCDATSMTYMVDRSGGVNFLEPAMHRDGRAGRARQAARLMTERLG